jgi:hypothetical protein
MLPDLDLLLNMDGLSLSGIAREMNMVSLVKRADTILKQLDAQPPGSETSLAVFKQLQSLWGAMRRLGLLEAIPDFDRDMVAAMAGSQSAQVKLAATGYWQFAETVFPRDTWVGESAAHCAEVERESQSALQLLRVEDYAGLACEIEANSTLSQYFKPVAVARLRTAVSVSHALAPRASALCELFLSLWVRLTCVCAKHFSDDSLIDTQRALLKVTADGQIKPGQAFFQWLKNELGAKTMAHILELAQLQSRDASDKWPDESTLKRWSCGRVFPSERAFKALLGHLACGWGDREMRTRQSLRIVAHYFLARRLDALIDLVQCLMPTHPGAQANSPFLDMLEAQTLEEWLCTGFEKWLTHWRESAAMSTGLP